MRENILISNVLKYQKQSVKDKINCIWKNVQKWEKLDHFRKNLNREIWNFFFLIIDDENDSIFSCLIKSEYIKIMILNEFWQEFHQNFIRIFIFQHECNVCECNVYFLFSLLVFNLINLIFQTEYKLIFKLYKDKNEFLSKHNFMSTDKENHCKKMKWMIWFTVSWFHEI